MRELLHAAYDGEPFVDVVDSPPHTAHVRGTNRAHVYGTVTGNRVLVESAIDNLWKGAAGQAVQDLNLMLGLDETEGLAVSFFASKWVDRPEHVTELAPTALPEGFVAGGVAAGIKPEGEDVGLLFSEREATTSAARFTTNALVAAPVIVAREADLAALRAVTVNSGNANVSDGERGLDTARAQQRAAAEALDLDPTAVAVASTGVIARELPRDKAVAGIRQAAEALAPNAQAFSESILTTDQGPKRACLELKLPSGDSVRLAGQAKGGGMISPHFATMLCFVQTDAGARSPRRWSC